MRAIAFQQFIEKLSPGMGSDEGFRYGDPDSEVTGILVCWMATLDAIRRAAAESCNLIVTHEDVYFPYVSRRQDLEQYLTWVVNRRRIEALAKNGMTVFRAHGMLDRLCILDDFAEMLGLPEPVVKEGYLRIYDMESILLRDLADRVKRQTGLAIVRVAGDLDRSVCRVGLPWGGLGLSVNVGFIQSLIVHHPDVLIAGESDEYAMRYALDAGVAMIETSHGVSEDPGLRNFADRLREAFPEVKVAFFECGSPWQAV